MRLAVPPSTDSKPQLRLVVSEPVESSHVSVPITIPTVGTFRIMGPFAEFEPPIGSIRVPSLAGQAFFLVPTELGSD